MLIVRRLQRRNRIFNQRRVSLAKLALPYAIELVAFSDKNQNAICLFQILSISCLKYIFELSMRKNKIRCNLNRSKRKF